MTLSEKREQWEKGLTVKTVLVRNDCDGNYKTIYVVLQDDRNWESYSLHRYFMIGSNWEVSADHMTWRLDEILEKLTEEFNDLVPKDTE